MPERHLTRPGLTLVLRDDAWRDTSPTADGPLVLEKQTRAWTATLSLSLAPSGDLRSRWTATPPQLSLPLSDTLTLTPFGKLARSRSLDLVLLWTELRDGENILLEGAEVFRLFLGLLHRPDGPGPDVHISATLQASMLLPLEKTDPIARELQQLVLKGTTLPRPAPPPPPAPAAAPALRGILSGARLWSGDSYSSGAAHGHGGYTREEILHLGADGRCRYERTTIVSLPGFSGLSLGSSGAQSYRQEGTWSLSGATLRLALRDGTALSWEVRAGQGCVYLDGERFFTAR